MYTSRISTDSAKWASILNSLPHSHLLQSWEWGEFKSRYSWTAHRWIWEYAEKTVAAAQVLIRIERRAGLRAGIMYVPRGPLLDWTDSALRLQVLSDLQDFARNAGVLLLKIDPEVPLGYGQPGTPVAADEPAGKQLVSELASQGWRESAIQIQFRNTVLLDITRPEDDILASFKQKTRYNIRLAGRRGVAVRLGSVADLPVLYRLYFNTSARDGFIIRDESYYLDLWQSFIQAGQAQALIAEVDGTVIAGLLLFFHRERATYMHGMSDSTQREKMPNHLLQWEAMRLAKARGCSEYDFWGAPDNFASSDSMWGVWRFKSGFRGQVQRTLGAWDLPMRQPQYWIYNVVMPRVLGVMRSRKRAQTAT